MKVYIIGYDLNSPGKNYQALFEAIKTLSSTWWHHLDSTWLVTTNLTAKEIRDRLVHHIDSNDELLVASLQGGAAWQGLSERGGQWLLTALTSGVPR